MANNKVIHESGKRKSAIARATIKPGKGVFIVNNKLIDIVEPKMAKMRILEPIILAGDQTKKFNITVKVKGGGTSSQADAARLAIAKALSKQDTTLREKYLDYDRQLLVADVRFKETRKPNSQGKARAKRQKSYR
ncbi:30S ribosomal protein S9 [Candidatus Woesearchaeota archaeon]|nr:30S ribosomal protein S9 [Candidatus Woesearchaeota archaeon]